MPTPPDERYLKSSLHDFHQFEYSYDDMTVFLATILHRLPKDSAVARNHDVFNLADPSDCKSFRKTKTEDDNAVRVVDNP